MGKPFPPNLLKIYTFQGRPAKNKPVIIGWPRCVRESPLLGRKPTFALGSITSSQRSMLQAISYLDRYLGLLFAAQLN